MFPITLGTETSKYQEERKSTESPEVVASEPGVAIWLLKSPYQVITVLTQLDLILI